MKVVRSALSAREAAQSGPSTNLDIPKYQFRAVTAHRERPEDRPEMLDPCGITEAAKAAENGDEIDDWWTWI
ncbi:MAG: hypothetical protein M3063_10350 [Actinomycetota bacterium]|nr:hypothetical protein [Actinomycetota bacterium]